MRLSEKLGSLFPAIRQHFLGRADTEHEQAFVRLGIGVLLFFYFFGFSQSQELQNDSWSLDFSRVMGLFLIASLALIVHIAIYPKVSPIRRLVAAALDSGTVTYFFFNAAESAIPLYFLYLWIIFGHGFRFGRRYLFFTLLISLAGFGAVILRIPYWQQNLFLGTGLWFGMLFVSMYVSSLIGRLTTALQHAEAANQAKRRFISSVSHELRTPLNAIIGMADLLRTSSLTSEQKDMVGSLDNASRVMLTLIEDVLDFSKIEAGKLLIENIPFDLHQLIKSSTDIFKYQAAQENLDLVTYIDPSVPYQLRGDPHHLRQVLANLLSNAIKFTKRGRVILRIEASVETRHSVKLRFEVEDTGIGIAPEAQAKVFESFTQAHESTARRYGGTGLGTTISKQLVELMGGSLGLRSELGVGSTFWFDLELEKQLIPLNRQQFAGLGALLVGFDQMQARQITHLLDECAIRHAIEPDISSAVMTLQRQPGSAVGLVLLNGTITRYAAGQDASAYFRTVADRLQSDAGPSLPIILCGAQGLGEKTAREVAEDSGLAAVLDFPVERRLLWNAIHAARSILPPPQVPPPQIIALEQKTDLPHARYRVLVAEDNPTNRAVIEKILVRAGYRCSLVENGEEALDLLAEEDFDALILDMNMPVMNGAEAARAFRFMRGEESRVPIIMFSANVTTEAKEECLSAGADVFLTKPIEVVSFLETLDRLLRESGAQRTQEHRKPVPARQAGATLRAQPQENEVVLNYATLAELESIGQGREFVDMLISGFVEDSEQLLDKLQGALEASRLEETREVLHALAGSAISVGAVSLRATCHAMEKLPRTELVRDGAGVMHEVRIAFDRLRIALDRYRSERPVVS